MHMRDYTHTHTGREWVCVCVFWHSKNGLEMRREEMLEVKTHRGVVGGDVDQHLRGAPAAHVSVAVPHAADQVGLSRGGAHTARECTRERFPRGVRA